MLNKEEEKAIERLKERINDSEDYKTVQVWLTDDVVAVNTVLNLITKLQKENEEKDKQIDLIIKEYEYNNRINFKNFCEDELRKDSCIQDCKLCAKHYFEKLAKEKDI